MLSLSGVNVDYMVLGPPSSEMTVDPFAAIPKDKGWAWMCLIGKFSKPVISVYI